MINIPTKMLKDPSMRKSHCQGYLPVAATVRFDWIPYANTPPNAPEVVAEA